MKKLNVFRLGLLFAGCFLGAGYVSGQELRQYFVVYGAKGYLGLLAAVAILYIFGVLCLRMAQNASCAFGTDFYYYRADSDDTVHLVESPWQWE